MSTKTNPTVRWEDVTALRHYLGQEVIARDLYNGGHTLSTIGLTLFHAAGAPEGERPDADPIAEHRAEIMRDRAAETERRAEAVRRGSAEAAQRALVADAERLLEAQKAEAAAGWRKVVDRINGTRRETDSAANHGWGGTVANLNKRLRREAENKRK